MQSLKRNIASHQYGPPLIPQVLEHLPDPGIEHRFSTVSACNVGDPGLIPGLGRSPGGGYGNPLPYSYLENPMDRGA